MPKVVFVPGFTQTGASWRAVTEIVREGADVLPLEVPVRDTFAATARSLAARAQHGVYVGYSMGGRLCLRIALDYPDLVEGLVLVSASPGIADAQARAERVASDEALARDIERDGVEVFLDRWLAQPMFAGVPPDASGLEDRRALPPQYVAHQLRVLGTGVMEPMWTRLSELRMPVALVTGTQDAKFEAIALQMLERIHGDVVHVRLDGGHALPLEQPAVLGGFVLAFASQHGHDSP